LIVHIITGLTQGGAENALFRLVSLAPDPSKVWVICLSHEALFVEPLRSLGVGVTCLGIRPQQVSPLKFLKMVTLLRRLRPDLVQTWMYHADLLGGIAARLIGVPVCWGIRFSNFSSEHSMRSTRLVARFCALLSYIVPARIISNSYRAIDPHRQLGYADRFVVIPNGLDVEKWCPKPELRQELRHELGLPADAFVFAHAGRGDPQKDHGTLALAFSKLAENMPQAHLLLCGRRLIPGDPYFETLPFSREARRRVVALGARNDLPDLWPAADGFVLSSAYGEGFPNVLAEAMACGLPCVTTDVGDAAAIVGDAGWVVQHSQPDQLTDAMIALARTNPDEYARLSHAARERIAQNFTAKQMASEFRRVWNEVLEDRS
jgi:glycosyltransferase involved in cell wall biosynthesis